jgi:signal transduction histidine kinase
MSSQATQPPHPYDAAPQGRSLFWKVLALVLMTAVIATTAIGIYFQYVLRDTYNDFIREQLASYVMMVADGIGHPPSQQAAERIAARYPIDIRIEGTSGSWATERDITASDVILKQTQPSPVEFNDSLIVRNYLGRFYAIIREPDWTYVIRLRSVPEQGALLPATLLLCVVLVLLFVAAYRYVQFFLRPITELMEGVTAVGSGDFEHRVPICSNDELGELTRAFNAMSEQVAAIIASKRRLLFDVSHELRSPLTRMNVALAMLPEGKARVSIERNVRELNTMITELLENERLAVLGSALIVEEVDVVDLVKHLIESFGYDERRIVFDSLTENVVITADSQRLKVAVRNVISNALKYSSDEPVEVTVFPDDEGARVVVTDHGIGIPPEAHEKVFEPFYRTDDSRSRATGGYGLGLPLTKAIVEAHGGTIQLTSTPGAGTTVAMWIPKTPAPGAVIRTVNGVPQTEHS